MGGGLGRKRVLELVAYCEDHVPYHRFLHEDTQGNTIATTSLWGDRLDEYDYTDYGIPIHAPVALDGRWITSITPALGKPHVSTVTVRSTGQLPPNDRLLSHNSALGCELRVAVEDPMDAAHVFLSGTVISQSATSFTIHDENNRIATAWQHTGPPTQGQPWNRQVDKGSAALFSLKQGFEHGVMDLAFNSTWTAPGPWYGQDCTFIDVADAPFEASMASSTLGYRYCKLFDSTQPVG